MASVPQIYTQATLKASVDTVNYPLDSNSLNDLLTIYQDFWTEIIARNENYSTRTLTIDSIPYQNKYALPVQSSSVQSIYKILSVDIAYQQLQYPTFTIGNSYSAGNKVLYNGLTYVSQYAQTTVASFDTTKWKQLYEGYSHLVDRSIENLPASYSYGVAGVQVDPFGYGYSNNNNYDAALRGGVGYYYMSQDMDNTTSLAFALYLNPAPTLAITQGIFITYIPTLKDLTITSVETDIFIEPIFHDVLAFGRAYLALLNQKRWDEANAMNALYEEMKRDALNAISDRVLSPGYVITPFLGYYMGG